MKCLILIAMLLASCAGAATGNPAPPATGPGQSPPPPSEAPASPQLIEVTAWPTVLELRTALATDYELVRDITDDGHIRWGTGDDSPIEILGKDTEPAEVEVNAALGAGHDAHLDIMITHFPGAVGRDAVKALASVREKLIRTGPNDHADVTTSTTGGTIEVSGFPNDPPIFVFLKPQR